MDDTTKSVFWQGVRDGAPFALVVTPFAMLFGVVATEAGLTVFETLTFSVVVIAGAAQFTAVQLLSNDAPTIIALVSALAVNLRMAMYSASLTPHIGGAKLWHRAFIAYFTVDQSYACSIIAYEKNPDWSMSQKVAYFFGTVTPVCPPWYVATVVGALIGNAVPSGLALDFALPITFLAMIAPMLRTLPHVIAAVTSVIVALLFAFIPFNLGLLVAGVVGMIAGAQAELWIARKGGTT